MASVGDESRARSSARQTRRVSVFYVMSAYHVSPWFTRGSTIRLLSESGRPKRPRCSPYGSLPGSPPTGRAAYQHDVALTLRYDLNPLRLLKVEGHSCTDRRSDQAAQRQPVAFFAHEDWGVLLLKTTAYFWSG